MFNLTKSICKILFILLWFMLLLGPITGCTMQKTNVISTNKFIQKDYDYNCLDITKTFTQIIICYQEQDASEKAQNKITNDLINKS